MKFFGKIAAALALFSVVPLTAQGPLPQAESGDGTSARESAPRIPAAGPVTLEGADLEAWLDGFLPYALERGGLAGAVVVVVKDGEPLLQKGYGYADVASRRPVDPRTTMFRPGSVSKLFTWTAVMQQVEAGKLDLDRDVNDYIDFEIPAFDDKPVTLRQIMTHTAGFEESIRHLITDDPEAVMPLKEYARKALPQRVFAPGTTPAYSNYATALAGYIVERASGMDFDTYVDRRIFTPLGMTYSTFRQPLPEKFEPYMASGYATADQPAKPFEIVIPAPAGSLSASGADMGKFMLAHLNQGGPLLKPETARLMHDFEAARVGPLNTMALGFYEQWINGHRAIGHGGDTGWFHSYLWLFPQSDIGLYISMNSDGKEGAAQAVRSALFQKFANRYLPNNETYEPIDAKTATEHARIMAGHYVMSRGAFTNFMSVLGLLGPLEVTVSPEGKLQVPALDGLSAGARDWVEVAPFVWRDTVTGERLAAEVKDGKVVRFSIDTLSPFTVITPAPAGTNPAWLIPALLAALGIVLLAALAWPVRALVRRSYKSEFALTGRSRTAYRLSRAFSWLVLLAVAGWIALIMTFSSDIGSVGGPLDWLIISLRILTPLASVGLLLSAGWHLWLCFRDGRKWTMKLGAVLLVLAGLLLCWVTLRFNLYGFGMVY